MSGFLYFVAGGKGDADRAALEKLGLDYAFDGSAASREVLSTNHQCGATGIVIGDPNGQPEGREVGMFDELQEWRRMPLAEAGPDLWIGWWKAHKPTPADLRRPVSLRTDGVLLDDGNYWDVPIVGHKHDNHLVADLPRFLTFDERGRRVPGRITGKFQTLWDVVSAVAEKKFAAELGEGEKPTEDEQWNATVALLSTTYRVGPIELLVLDTFVEGSIAFGWVWSVATEYALVLAAIEALGKKKEPSISASESTSAGDAA